MKIKTIKVGSLKTNCYLLISAGELLIIDPGAEPKKIIREIEKEKAEPIGILNTHSHYDHVGANQRLKDKYDIEILTSDNLSVGNLTLKVLDTPGHKDDCVCVLGNEFAFTGDTIFKKVHGRVDLAEGSIEKMEESLEKLAENLETGMNIFPGHGESFKLETINLKSKYLKND